MVIPRPWCAGLRLVVSSTQAAGFWFGPVPLEVRRGRAYRAVGHGTSFGTPDIHSLPVAKWWGVGDLGVRVA